MLECSHIFLSLTATCFPRCLKALYFSFEIIDAPIYLCAAFPEMLVVEFKAFGSEVEDLELKIGYFQAELKEIGIDIMLVC